MTQCQNPYQPTSRLSAWGGLQIGNRSSGHFCALVLFGAYRWPRAANPIPVGARLGARHRDGYGSKPRISQESGCVWKLTPKSTGESNLFPSFPMSFFVGWVMVGYPVTLFSDTKSYGFTMESDGLDLWNCGNSKVLVRLEALKQ